MTKELDTGTISFIYITGEKLYVLYLDLLDWRNIKKNELLSVLLGKNLEKSLSNNVQYRKLWARLLL